MKSIHGCLVLLALAACGEAHGPDAAGPDSCDTGETLTFDIYLTAYAREDAEGRVAGMNLDGRVSDVTDEEGCYQPDFAGVDGEEGVDNQWGGALAHELESDPYLVETGPIALVLGGVDDLLNDECVTFQLGNGAPVESQLVDGRLHAQGDGTLIVEVGDRWHMTMGSFPVRGLSMKGQLDATSALTAVVVAAHMDVDEVVAHVMVEAPEVNPDLIRTTLQGIADLHRDDAGDCQSVSAAFLAESRTD